MFPSKMITMTGRIIRWCDIVRIQKLQCDSKDVQVIMEGEKALRDKNTKQPKEKWYVVLRRNPFWILFVFFAVYILFSSLIMILTFDLCLIPAVTPYVSKDSIYVLLFYTSTIISVIILFLLCWIVRYNRYIWKSFLYPRRHSASKTDMYDVLADLYGRRNNGFGMLGFGLLLGFLMNFFCIACALIHGDIRLYFEAAPAQIPLFLFAFVSVFIQSSSEELWCRGFLYERLHERYPLWAAILINGVIFGALHLLNDGASFLPILDIVICGISFSLLRWYTGNIWIVMGVHTGWNFTQAFLFGLPNSGLVSGVSLFHLDASTGINNLIYNFDFGVEGGIPALIADALLGVVVIVLAAKKGRLKELKMNRPKALKASGLTTD